mmetsp:Transcript_44450/g.81131  ORF Transcript_44450/g.81131 Transcript_44450/m.81131 type:complete len:288 (+) Transcript_44450:144-1007(+)
MFGASQTVGSMVHTSHEVARVTHGLAQPNTTVPPWGDPADAQVPFAELLAQLSRARAEHRPVFVKEPWPAPAPPVQVDAGKFHVVSSVGAVFDAHPGFLRPKQFNCWDEERMTWPERAWPVKGSAGHLYDRQRKGRPPWRPTQEYPSDIKFETFEKQGPFKAPAQPGHATLGATQVRPSSAPTRSRPSSGKPLLSPRETSSPAQSPRGCTPFSRPPTRGAMSVPTSPAKASALHMRPSSAPRARDPAQVVFQRTKPVSQTIVRDVGRPMSAIGRRPRPNRLSSPRAR